MAQNVHTYVLKGIIYFGQFHFTSQFFASNGEIWYHDGATTKEKLEYVGNISTTPMSELNSMYKLEKDNIQEYNASIALYTKL